MWKELLSVQTHTDIRTDRYKRWSGRGGGEGRGGEGRGRRGGEERGGGRSHWCRHTHTHTHTHIVSVSITAQSHLLQSHGSIPSLA